MQDARQEDTGRKVNKYTISGSLNSQVTQRSNILSLVLGSKVLFYCGDEHFGQLMLAFIDGSAGSERLNDEF